MTAYLINSHDKSLLNLLSNRHTYTEHYFSFIKLCTTLQKAQGHMSVRWVITTQTLVHSPNNER